VPEGTYTYKLIKGKDTFEGTVNLVADPRSPHSAEDRKLQQETALELYDALEGLTYVIDTLIDVRDQTKGRAEEAGGRGGLAKNLEAYADELETFRGSLVSTAETGWISGDEKLREKMGNLFGGIVNYDGRPTQSQIDRKDVLIGQLTAAEARFEELTTSKDLTSLNSQLQGRGLEVINVMSREEWEENQNASGSSSSGVSAKRLAGIMASRALMPLGF
jgi:predicted HicB family RNase H-like nuclease